MRPTVTWTARAWSVRWTGASLLALLLGGCTGDALRCDKPFEIYEDEDGDGFGTRTIGRACELAPGQAREPLDCDDTNADIHPGVDESCDGLDNDCDGVRDNGFERKLWYVDLDADGFGAAFPVQEACDRPDEGWVQKAGDCDDGDPTRNPGEDEVCGGTDEDCDGFEGDFDDSVDISTFVTFYRDADGDGMGDAGEVGRACQLPPGYSPNNLDCNDDNPLVGQLRFFTDSDGDGFGDPNQMTLACAAPEGTVQNNFDCDDTNSAYNIDKRWYLDEDLDGHGSGVPIAYQCTPPTPEATEDHSDCDDRNPDIHPGAVDICLDGTDGDCNGSDACRTCLEQLIAAPESESGVYDLMPDGNIVRQVYCDMETDGGGWTMVGSSIGAFSDVRGNYHYELDTLTPNGWHTAVWDGLRDITQTYSDIRFACRRGALSNGMTVDLSFYNVDWYWEITASYSDSQTCFNEGTSLTSEAPARRNNLTGEFLPEGDPYNSGRLVGEDYCGDYGDFSVDFDDGGVLGDPNDGTDWGIEGYGQQKCGNTSGGNLRWFIFVRELATSP